MEQDEQEGEERLSQGEEEEEAEGCRLYQGRDKGIGLNGEAVSMGRPVRLSVILD